MKRFGFVLVLIAVGIVGLGFYRGWFNLGSENTHGQSNVTLSVDGDKFRADRKAAMEGVQNLGGKSESKISSKTHDGKVISITEVQLLMTDMDGQKEHMHTLTAGVTFTCDGVVCKVSDLKPGMRIRVTTGDTHPYTTTRVEALDNNRDFEKDT